MSHLIAKPIERLYKVFWFVPQLAILLPLNLLFFGWMLNDLGYNGRVVLPVFWLLVLASPFIGVLTLIIMHVQNNLNRVKLKERHALYAVIFAFADMTAPIWLLISFLLIFGLRD